ncbi:MAG TPA: YIP1 family protein [Candidatus Bathyarchaeia archaeon]|nr:YIP1 family protein [Candidatus Bathyarchaeia archaeon]
MFLYDIFKIIYSPIKAFKEIMTNPRYIGPILIIIVSLFLTLGTQYISVSKQNVETITPSNPVAWTNMTNPLLMWTSNAPPSNVTAAPTRGQIPAGNYSVSAFLSNTTAIWLNTKNIGTINCSQTSGFKILYYKLNYSQPSPLNASNAELRLFSEGNESKYFEHDLLELGTYINESGSWIDTNITLGQSSENWASVGSPSWSSITGMEFMLNFSTAGPVTLQLNAVYFGGKYEPFIEAVGLATWLFSTITASFFNIFLRWLIFAVLLWLTVRVFNPTGSPFRTLLIMVGYSFAIMFVYLPLELFSVSQLPSLYFAHKIVFPLSPREIAVASSATSNIYAANWTSKGAYMAFIGIEYASYAWMIGMFTVGLRTMQNMSWKRAAVICVVSYFIALFVISLVSSLVSV